MNTLSLFNRVGLRLLAVSGLLGTLLLGRIAAPAATITVNSTNDPGGFNTNITVATLGATVTLRDAINAANNSGGANVITFDPSIAGQTLRLTNVQDTRIGASALVISATNLTVQGLTGNAGVTIDGGGTLRPFIIRVGAVVTFNDLTIANGKASDGGALENSGNLTLNRCTLSGNTSTHFGGALHHGYTAGLGQSATLANCTVVSNSATTAGGGLYNNDMLMKLVNVTLVGNSSANGGGFFSVSANTLLTNSIVISNTAPTFPDIYVFTGQLPGANNLIGTGGAGGLTNGVNGNLVGVTSPGLGALANNGGPTKTIALLAGSPAINAGLTVAGVTTDQRGATRTAPSDIGAFESPAAGDDFDADGLPDSWELANFGNLGQGGGDDADADGFNNATEYLAGSDPNLPGSKPGSTYIARVFGAGAAGGLDLTGNFLYAFNVGTPGAAGQAGDANFTADTAPGITVSAPNEIANWTAREFGSTAADNVLETVYRSIRWADLGNAVPESRKLKVDLANLVVGHPYKLQLLFGENGGPHRAFDVFVAGVLVVNDFVTADAQGAPYVANAASAVVHEFTATNATLNIVLDGANVAAAPGLDQNPILNGVTLEDLATVIVGTPPRLTNPTRQPNGAFHFAFTNLTGASFTVRASTNITLPFAQWSNLGGPVESPAGSGQFQFTDSQATNNSQRYYRVTSP